MATKNKIKKEKLSECCNASMLGGVQCENCGSDGKFTTGTAIVKRLDKIIKLLVPTEIKTTAKGPEQATRARFIDNGDGTISDTKTKLMWQKQGSTERLTYAKAEEFVVELNREEWNDWRIPTREELESILDLERRDPAIDPIFKCESAGYWSSTIYAGYADFAWGVDFSVGFVSVNFRYFANFVRPVRQYF